MGIIIPNTSLMWCLKGEKSNDIENYEMHLVLVLPNRMIWRGLQPITSKRCSQVSAKSYHQVIHHVLDVVTPDMNRMLLEEYSHEEVKEALFQMYQTKAPGHDGMNPLFFIFLNIVIL